VEKEKVTELTPSKMNRCNLIPFSSTLLFDVNKPKNEI